MSRNDARTILEKEIKKAHIDNEIITHILKTYDEQHEKVSSKLMEKIKKFELFPTVSLMMDAACAAFCICFCLSGKVSFERKEDDPKHIFSKADLLSSKVIHSILSVQYPTHGYVDEEMGCINTEERFVFIVDPLDGSASWILGIEEGWAIGIALYDAMDVALGGTGIISSVIVSPRMYDGDWMLVGIKEVGCFSAVGTQQKVRTVVDPKSFGVSFGHKDLRGGFWNQASIDKIAKEVMRLYVGIDAQHSGSWIAQGKLDLFIRMQQPSYDIAPIICLVEAAGGKVMDAQGKTIQIVTDISSKNDYIIWSGQPKVRDWILKILKKN